MDWLSQSSLLSQTPQSWSQSLLSPPRRVVVKDGNSHFRYWIEGGFREGAVVHYQMLVGLRRLSWQAVVVRAKEASYIETELANTPNAPFRDFAAVHYFRPYLTGQTVVRDELEFDATADITQFLKSGWASTIVENSAASTEEQTGEMRLYGSEMG